jgi:hypothetical protein
LTDLPPSCTAVIISGITYRDLVPAVAGTSVNGIVINPQR